MVGTIHWKKDTHQPMSLAPPKHPPGLQHSAAWKREGDPLPWLHEKDAHPHQVTTEA